MLMLVTTNFINFSIWKPPQIFSFFQKFNQFFQGIVMHTKETKKNMKCNWKKKIIMNVNPLMIYDIFSLFPLMFSLNDFFRFGEEKNQLVPFLFSPPLVQHNVFDVSFIYVSSYVVWVECNRMLRKEIKVLYSENMNVFSLPRWKM